MAKKDIQDQVTNTILEALEAGVKPWEKPWDGNGLSLMPVNFKTNTSYSGINVLLLWVSAAKNGFTTQSWLTYKQASELGGQVRKGEKGTTCIFYKTFEKVDKNTGEEETFRVMRSFTVFNIDQIDGIEMPAPVKAVSKELLHSHAAKFVDATGIIVNHGYESACYVPAQNAVFMPSADDFNTEEDYWATLFHEISHATAHKSRLGRDTNSADKKSYAFEEIIVEIASSMLMAHFGIHGQVQHEEYIGHWLTALDNDKRYIFKAASQASKIFNYFMQYDAKENTESIAA